MKIHVHTGPLGDDKKISEETIARVKHGLRLYDLLEASEIIFSGGAGQYETLGWMSVNDPSMASLMERYAREQGFRGNIRTENHSRDTVGELFYTEHLPELASLEDITHVTSQHAFDRYCAVADVVTPIGRRWLYDCAAFFYPTREMRDMRYAHEPKGKALFLEQFAGVPKGDGKAFEERMFSRHGIYSKLPEEEKVRIYTKAD